MAGKVLIHDELMFPSEYVNAAELKGRDVGLTIATVSMQELKLRGGASKRKPVLTFKGTPKKMVLNVTNADTIASMHGTIADQWVGKRITVYPTKTKMGRETVECIRVRDTTPAPRQPSLTNRPVSEGQTFVPDPDAIEEAHREAAEPEVNLETGEVTDTPPLNGRSGVVGPAGNAPKLSLAEYPEFLELVNQAAIDICWGPAEVLQALNGFLLVKGCVGRGEKLPVADRAEWLVALQQGRVGKDGKIIK